MPEATNIGDHPSFKGVSSLNTPTGGGTFDGMEARLAKLEAQMEHVHKDLAKLAVLPVDVATIKERLVHLPTKDEARNTLDSALDRAGAKTQRGVGLIIGIGGLLITGVSLLIKFYAG
ncbi:tetrahydromethanopterin S-methyltransferase subunit G [Novosphingobium fluoreni]|uniref:Tetrahydromethanopterin S-methyltransferase subunit G n=1 Tax=Novosphingobium fluoreni TaxID=1391222 RepID=A0A7W6C1E7_9SPHN|nr:hypothetical protein [Novosphingobium fluoreni]MBB3940717.1 tetrahydromethanopterin S-methyltransferase subunit G [Novosphingobium fluoreni]